MVLENSLKFIDKWEREREREREREGLKNPGWEICLKNLHKDKIEICVEVKCKRHIMSKKERFFGIYFVFSL